MTFNDLIYSTTINTPLAPFLWLSRWWLSLRTALWAWLRSSGPKSPGTSAALNPMKPSSQVCPKRPPLLKKDPRDPAEIMLFTVCSACRQPADTVRPDSFHPWTLWCPLQDALMMCWWDIRWSTWGWWSIWGSDVLGLLTDANTSYSSRGS